MEAGAQACMTDDWATLPSIEASTLTRTMGIIKIPALQYCDEIYSKHNSKMIPCFPLPGIWGPKIIPAPAWGGTCAFLLSSRIWQSDGMITPWMALHYIRFCVSQLELEIQLSWYERRGPWQEPRGQPLGAEKAPGWQWQESRVLSLPTARK